MCSLNGPRLHRSLSVFECCQYRNGWLKCFEGCVVKPSFIWAHQPPQARRCGHLLSMEIVTISGSPFDLAKGLTYAVFWARFSIWFTTLRVVPSPKIHPILRYRTAVVTKSNANKDNNGCFIFAEKLVGISHPCAVIHLSPLNFSWQSESFHFTFNCKNRHKHVCNVQTPVSHIQFVQNVDELGPSNVSAFRVCARIPFQFSHARALAHQCVRLAALHKILQANLIVLKIHFARKIAINKFFEWALNWMSFGAIGQSTCDRMHVCSHEFPFSHGPCFMTSEPSVGRMHFPCVQPSESNVHHFHCRISFLCDSNVERFWMPVLWTCACGVIHFEMATKSTMRHDVWCADERKVNYLEIISRSDLIAFFRDKSVLIQLPALLDRELCADAHTVPSPLTVCVCVWIIQKKMSAVDRAETRNLFEMCLSQFSAVTMGFSVTL